MKLGFNKITKKFDDKIIAQAFTLLFESQKTVCIMGPSGCGKTTLLNIAANLTPIQKGNLEGFSGKKISYVFQQPRLLPFMNTVQNISLVMKQKNQKRVEELIALVHLEGSESLYPDELSGGMQQRVSFARALAYEPDIILADEPASNLDVPLKESMYRSLREYAKANKISVLMVTHDPQDCVRYADEVAVLSKSPVHIVYRADIPPDEGKQNILDQIMLHIQDTGNKQL